MLPDGRPLPPGTLRAPQACPIIVRATGRRLGDAEPMSRIVVRTHRQELVTRRRMIAAVSGSTFIIGFLVGFVAGTLSAGTPRRDSQPASGSATATATQTTRPPAAANAASEPARGRGAAPPAGAPVVAWQPSHQEEKLRHGYREYRAMGALAALAAGATRRTRSVIAWETGMGLTGKNALPQATNTGAFDSEIKQALDASATFFVGLQTDVSDKRGVVVYYQEDDETSAEMAQFLADRLSATAAMPRLGRLGVRFYSLDPARNKVPYRVSVEFRDDEAALVRLAAPARQGAIARALAQAVDAYAARVRR